MPLPERSAIAQYVGDGVYVDVVAGDVVLTTENGIDVTNRIVNEPGVLESFLRWITILQGAANADQGDHLVAQCGECQWSAREAFNPLSSSIAERVRIHVRLRAALVMHVKAEHGS